MSPGLKLSFEDLNEAEEWINKIWVKEWMRQWINWGIWLFQNIAVVINEDMKKVNINFYIFIFFILILYVFPFYALNLLHYNKNLYIHSRLVNRASPILEMTRKCRAQKLTKPSIFENFPAVYSLSNLFRAPPAVSCPGCFFLIWIFPNNIL